MASSLSNSHNNLPKWQSFIKIQIFPKYKSDQIFFLCLKQCYKVILYITLNPLNQTKAKEKIKICILVHMVISGIIILMPTLGINSSSFLNLAPWCFCILCKTISRWAFWSWPIMQKHFQLILIRVQSGNLLTEIRSTHFGNFSKWFLFCKPRPLVCFKYYWPHPQILVWTNSSESFIQPFYQAHVVHFASKMESYVTFNF